MANRSTARQPARTATPEELAEENKRARIAQSGSPFPDENGDRIPPKPDPEFARKVRWVLGYDNLLDTLGKGEWLPRTPEDIAAALRILGEEASANLIFREEAPDEIEALKERLSRLDQRLDPATDRIQGLERRLALLEARMSTSPEWSSEPGNKAEEGLLGPLRLGDGEVDWSPDEEPTGDALHDLDTGALRPQTWPQLVRCLQVLANHVNWMLNDHIDAEVDRDGVLRAVNLLIGSAGIHRGPGVR